MELSELMSSLMAINARKYTMRRAYILLAIQANTAASNSEFTRLLRVSAANVTTDFKWLTSHKLIYPLDTGHSFGDQRRQRYALTRLGYQSVAAIAMTK